MYILCVCVCLRARARMVSSRENTKKRL